jgi:hypothetical protein
MATPPTLANDGAQLGPSLLDTLLAQRLDLMDPVMTPGELLTLQWCASQARTYVEYGSGASTVQAALLAGNALSIENGGTW